jgi:UDP-N-acetylmuramoyl-L-alanyl-D-glutamate--2,6-diaminopimelate ligase
MLLKDLLLALPDTRLHSGTTGVEVSSLCTDSRQVTAGSGFIAVKGTAVDGHNFIAQAVAQGAAVIFSEHLVELASGTTALVVVPDTTQAAGLLADRFYEQPSSQLRIVGVTGTNGKTTCATLLYQLFTALGYQAGLLSTVENKIGDRTVPATHTTPDPISLHALLRTMVDAGCTHAFMEVSSHAVVQQRIAGVRFAGGVFTNITHDHLDYHGTFDAYIRAKKGFFDNLPKESFALVNADDKRGAVMQQNTAAQKVTYSLREPATFKAKVLENGITGLVLQIGQQEAHFRMIGIFNAYNLLAVYGAAVLLGEDKNNVLEALTALSGAAGRFETLRSPQTGILGIVDYAHTPDALLNVLATINQFRKEDQAVITVVGCGGNRDAAKRPVMGMAACEHSTKAIFTSDNPRFEHPEVILTQMEAELSASQQRKALRIADRREAIRTACMLARPGDIVLVAGKGHETYQEIEGVKHPFDDRQVLAETFEQLSL